jgi:hypothetical protein
LSGTFILFYLCGFKQNPKNKKLVSLPKVFMDNIENILKNVIHQIVEQSSSQSHQINNVWDELLTPKELQHTKLEGMSAGEIVVAVDSPAWLYHMRTRKDYLLKELKKKHPGINNIRLKVGKL